MILGDPQRAAHRGRRAGATLDDLFRRAAARRPDAIALVDPPNRASFTDGAPRRLTYAEADRIVSAIAGRLRRLGLPTDAVVALQLPNTVESVLTLLGVLRAGMIAAPLPLLWRRADAVAALSRVGAKAIITSVARRRRRPLRARHARRRPRSSRSATSAASAHNLPDGVIPFDDLLAAAPLLDPAAPVERDGNPAAHVAVVTFDVTPDGLVAVGAQPLRADRRRAGGAAGRRHCRRTRRSSPRCATSSFAGLALERAALAARPAARCRCTSRSIPSAFAAQCRHDDCDTVVLPGALAARLAEAGLLAHPGLRNVLALWRAPERLPVGAPWQHPRGRAGRRAGVRRDRR